MGEKPTVDVDETLGAFDICSKSSSPKRSRGGPQTATISSGRLNLTHHACCGASEPHSDFPVRKVTHILKKGWDAKRIYESIFSTLH